MDRELEWFFKREKMACQKHFLSTCENITPKKMKVTLSGGEAVRILELDENLTSKIKDKFPETLFVITNTRYKGELVLDKYFELYFKKDAYHGVYYVLEEEGAVAENLSATVTVHDDYWVQRKVYYEGEEEYKDFLGIADTFKNEILDLKEYRLYAVTGIMG